MLKCSYCNKKEEVRPYGKKGALICFDCGMLPENISETENQFHTQLNGIKDIAIIGKECGPYPLNKSKN